MPHSLTVLREPAPERADLERDALLTLATAEDLESGMAEVVESLQRESAAERVEWWTAGDGGDLELAAAAGVRDGDRRCVPIWGVGTFVLHGSRLDPELEAVLTALTPVIRRRAAEDQLTRTAVQLARRNEALEDYAALVAHELKNPLQAALLAEDPSRQVEDALALVDALLEAARSEADEPSLSSAEEPLRRATEDLGADVEVTSDLATPMPLGAGALRVILRNLVSNAIAAGARHVHVTALRSPGSWRLLVDDDGVGLADAAAYSSGSGLGLGLARRLAGRFGGSLELLALPSGGTRAALEFARVTS
jgi:signal transduction histidine kinase